MRIIPLLTLTLCLLACDRDDVKRASARDQARSTADSQDRFVDSSSTPLSPQDLAQIERLAWEKARRPGCELAHRRAFLQEHPGSEHASEVRALLAEQASAQATSSLRSLGIIAKDADVEELLGLITTETTPGDGGRSWVKTTYSGSGKRMSARALLLLERRRLSQVIPFAVKSIQPLAKAPPDFWGRLSSGVFANDRLDFSVQGSSSQQVEAEAGTDVEAFAEKLFRGDPIHVRVDQVASYSENVRDRVEVSQTDSGFDLVGTNMGGSPVVGLESRPIVPMADRSVFCFQGCVAGFFPGIVFESDEFNPLSFVLVAEVGLAYASGEGRVTLADGTEVRLPRSAP